MSTEPVYMPHPGHFICAQDCCFFLNTYVNGYIVSTVGELLYGSDRALPDSERAKRKWRPLGAGADSLYETMVFPAKRAGRPAKYMCCPWEASDFSGIDSQRYATATAAAEGHAAFVAKYAKARGER